MPSPPSVVRAAPFQPVRRPSTGHYDRKAGADARDGGDVKTALHENVVAGCRACR